MLTTKIFSNSKDVAGVALAINHAKFGMMIEMDNDSISRIEKRLNSKTLMPTTKQVAAWKEEIETLKAEIKTLTTQFDATQENYDTVVNGMVAPSDKGYSNDRNVVVRFLRIMASASNSKLEKYALKGYEWDESLASAFDTIHLFDDNNTSENGKIKASKSVKQAYADAENLIDKTLRDAFSLPVATDYNSAFRCKFNATTLKMLHESYVRGLSNKYKFSKDEDNDDIEYKSTKARTLIQVKVKKDGTRVYNYNGFNEVVTKLVIAKIAEA